MIMSTPVAAIARATNRCPATAAAVDLAFPTLLRSDIRAGTSNGSLGGGEETRFINLDATKHRASAGYVQILPLKGETMILVALYSDY